MNHRIVQRLLETPRRSDGSARFSLFGSHLTGLAHTGSDVDVLCGLVDGEGLDGLREFLKDTFEGQFREVNFLGRATPIVPRLGIFGPAHNNYDADVDPSILAIFKWTDKLTFPDKPTFPKSRLASVDVIVVDQEEAARRLRTLNVIRELVEEGDTDIRTFVTKLKSDHSSYRALHNIVDRARGT